jgi:predicted RNA-binding Zn ribbon-like protein
VTASEHNEAEAVAITFANLGYDLDDPRPELAEWLRTRLGSPAKNPRQLERLVAVQAAVRAVFDARIDDQLANHPEAVAALNAASRAAPISPILVIDRSGAASTRPASDIDDARGVLAEVGRSAIDVVTAGAARLRRCDGPNCNRYFLRDRAHRNWCSLGCGNRARVARHYQHSRLAR